MFEAGTRRVTDSTAEGMRKISELESNGEICWVCKMHDKQTQNQAVGNSDLCHGHLQYAFITGK